MASMLVQGPKKETGVKKELNGGRIIAVEEVVFFITCLILLQLAIWMYLN
jgi:hypothetical protein